MTVTTELHRTGRAGGAAELQSLGAPLAWILDEGIELNTARNALCIHLNDTGDDVAPMKGLSQPLPTTFTSLLRGADHQAKERGLGIF